MLTTYLAFADGIPDQIDYVEVLKNDYIILGKMIRDSLAKNDRDGYSHAYYQRELVVRALEHTEKFGVKKTFSEGYNPYTNPGYEYGVKYGSTECAKR